MRDPRGTPCVSRRVPLGNSLRGLQDTIDAAQVEGIDEQLDGVPLLPELRKVPDTFRAVAA